MVSLIDTIDAAAEAQKQRAAAAAAASTGVAGTTAGGSKSAASTAGGALTASGKPKEKRRNNEKRKEKSRDAARCRRSKETEIFTELSQSLPLKVDDVNQLDKASVMRITIAYLKIREMLQLVPKIRDIKTDLNAADLEDDDDDENLVKPKLEEISDEDWLRCAEASQLLKQTMDGFLLILSNEGDITYVSENIVDYLGITKIDALGQQIWEYTHQCDHAEIKEALNLKRNGIADKIKDEHLLDSSISTHHRDLSVRLKCTLTSRGRSINIKSASYKVIHITGHLVVNSKSDRVLIAIGRPIPHPSNIEIPLGSSTFLTKHALDMKFTYVDDKMLSLLGYAPNNLLDRSLFDCHHAADSERLMATFKSVLSKGQGETSRYRFLGKTGGYCWIVTQATIVYDKSKPQSVVCVNYVVSNLENKHEIYSLAQQTAASEKKDLQQQQQQQTAEQTDNNQETTIKTTTKSETTTTTTTVDEEAAEKSIPAAPPAAAATEIDLVAKLQTPIEKTNTTPNKLIKSNNSNNINNNNNNINNNNNNIPPLVTTLKINQQTNILRAKSSTADWLIKRENHSPGPRTITSQIFNKQPLRSLPFAGRLEEKRPKSVTASVFRNTTSTVAATAPPLASTAQPQLEGGPSPTSSTSSSKALHFSAAAVAAAVAAEQLLPPTTTATAAILSSSNQQQQQQPTQSQDMSKGFLSFGDDGRGLTMLKEEPDDLSHHLAASACIQLEEITPFNEMFVGLMGTCLLSDDINSLDSTTCSTTASAQNYNSNNISNNSNTSNNNNNNNSYSSSSNNNSSSANSSNNNNNNNNNNSNHSANSGPTNPNSNSNSSNNNDNSNSSSNIDPLFNYREESNDTICSQHLHSPSVTSKSPEDSSLPSLCSPHSLTQEEDYSFDDFQMRAPYIPMGDDMPLLAESDLMWCPSDDLQIMHKDFATVNQQLQQQLQHQQQQLQHHYDYQQQQTSLNSQQQQHFSNSLCSSPASTVSSLSPSPVQQQQHHQQQQANVFTSDTSELAALLGGTGSGTLSILSGTNAGEECMDRLGVNAVQQHQEESAAHYRSLQQLQQELQLEDEQQQRQQQQQQQQHLLSLSIECKREKYDAALAPSLCHSIEDAFGYSKDSTNLDCWSDLLQMNASDAAATGAGAPTANGGSSPMASPTASPHLMVGANKAAATTIQLLQQQQQQQLQQMQHQHQQNIILNAVPLITIQNSKTMLLQQPQTQQQLQLPAMKLVNGTTIAPVSSKATIRLVETKSNATPQQQQQQLHQRLGLVAGKGTTLQTLVPQQQQQQQQHGNKRHLSNQTTVGNVVESKRLKSGQEVVQATPQLLQQLIGKDQPRESRESSKKSNSWNSSIDAKQQLQQKQQQQHHQQQQQQQSNSVLKNLLVSGRDNKNISIETPEPMLIDDNSLEQPTSDITRPIMSSDISKYATPLHCNVSMETVLLNCSNNPLISGTNFQPSPVLASPSSSNGDEGSGDGTSEANSILSSQDDSMPPGLMACDTDASSDSGIDDNNGNVERSSGKGGGGGGLVNIDMSALKQTLAKASNPEPPAPPAQPPPLASLESQQSPPNLKKVGESTSSSRKTSISFMDSSNPLLRTPDWMELCNDDYHMSGGDYEFSELGWAELA